MLELLSKGFPLYVGMIVKAADIDMDFLISMGLMESQTGRDVCLLNYCKDNNCKVRAGPQ